MSQLKEGITSASEMQSLLKMSMFLHIVLLAERKQWFLDTICTALETRSGIPTSNKYVSPELLLLSLLAQRSVFRY